MGVNLREETKAGRLTPQSLRKLWVGRSRCFWCACVWLGLRVLGEEAIKTNRQGEQGLSTQVYSPTMVRMWQRQHLQATSSPTTSPHSPSTALLTNTASFARHFYTTSTSLPTFPTLTPSLYDAPSTKFITTFHANLSTYSPLLLSNRTKLHFFPP